MELAILQSMKAREIMTTELITVSCDTTMLQASGLLNKHKIHHLIIVSDEGDLKGIISQIDIERMKDWTTSFNLGKAETSNRMVMSSQYVSDCMGNSVMSVGPEDNLSYCADIILENYFHAVPVVEGGKPIGIITSFDLINTAYGRKLIHSNV